MGPERRLVSSRDPRSAASCRMGSLRAATLSMLGRNWGVQDYMAEGPLKDYLTHPAVHVEYVMAGLMFGILSGVVNRLTEKVWLRSRSFGLAVLTRSALYVGCLALVAGAVILVFLLTRLLTVEALVQVFRSFSIRYLLSVGVWLALVVIGINFLMEVRRLVGEVNLWRLVTGHYRRPREEVKDATTHVYSLEPGLAPP